jgi:hypothetical protein
MAKPCAKIKKIKKIADFIHESNEKGSKKKK